MSTDLAAIASPAAIDHLRWSLTAEVGPILFRRIIEHFGSAQAAFGAGVQTLQGVEGIGPTLAERIARSRDTADIEPELALAHKHGVRILCPEDEGFPRLLRHIPDPPICLYVRGELRPEDWLSIAVVGARRCTIYGREQAGRFGHQLGLRGITVISGLARGVDGEAHKGALTAGGRTLAVLGNGLASIYPPEHRELAARIAENGALISELPMTTSPARENFLPRNRLIAGLSLGVLVIEAARRSGSLSTAARASEYNREVFALPGRVDSEFSSGTNALIRDQHAKLVACVDDILDELGEAGEILKKEAEAGGQAQDDAAPPRLNLSEDERDVYAILSREEQSIEMIAEAAGKPASRIASTLITLQLKGLVRQLPGGRFVRPAKPK
ncbi:MAG TPA: DNA-processing protein DprA [Phycisphaerae bacterium]|nr:DNA-protecting protein DprA [Phycisphaerae bacterium]HOB76524.1 DNA-processing protein DprA [Phycisphaerae bacterium]HOJ55442.1 DNA-processing protein DprA [Phycisphaerae bacterium]HOL25671.1 DNA-processing protein DprA [Phycisphaerae bacterium]HPP19636.1 DNA-processing protein DprA [Phycisphaerae bacterium]